MTLADILRDRIAAQTERQPTIGAATGPAYFGSFDPLTEYGGAVEESYNPLEDLAPVGGLRRLLGLGGAALGFGTMPAWKLTKNAPSWFQRAFKGGKREVPLQGRTPKRLSPTKVLEPEVVSTPSDEIPGNFLKQLGLPTRLEDARPGTPWHEALYWQRAMGGSEGPTAARRLGRSEAGGLVKKPVTYEIPESNAGLKQLLEREGGAYTGLGGEEGTTRLYRGESPGPTDAPEWAKRHSGEWFTPSKEKAQEFQSFYDKGRLKFVDVPQGELEQLNELVTRAFGKMNRVPDDEYLIPREIQDKLWTRFLKEQPERKFPPISGGADIPIKRLTKEQKKLQHDQVMRGYRILMGETEEPGLAPLLKKYPKKRKPPPVSGGVDLPKKMSKKQFEIFKMWLEKVEREEAIPVQPPYQEVDAYLKPPVQPGLAPLLKKREKKLPPVSGGAPSPFDKFTSKGLPIPKEFAEYHEKLAKAGPHEKKYIEKGLPVPKQTEKSTQDILGRFQQQSEYPIKNTLEDFFDDVFPVREEYNFFGEPTGRVSKTRNLLETVREAGQKRGLTDDETAALVRRAEQMGTNALDAVRPPPEPEQLRAWVKSVLGH